MPIGPVGPTDVGRPTPPSEQDLLALDPAALAATWVSLQADPWRLGALAAANARAGKSDGKFAAEITAHGHKVSRTTVLGYRRTWHVYSRPEDRRVLPYTFSEIGVAILHAHFGDDLEPAEARAKLLVPMANAESNHWSAKRFAKELRAIYPSTTVRTPRSKSTATAGEEPVAPLDPTEADRAVSWLKTVEPSVAAEVLSKRGLPWVERLVGELHALVQADALAEDWNSSTVIATLAARVPPAVLANALARAQSKMQEVA